MPPTVSPYDIYLGEKDAIQGYRVRSISRDSAPLVAPRFSTGQSGETELDLLKSTSVENFSGGMFQRDWFDNTKVARLLGIYNPYDSMLYPSIAPTAYGSSLTLGRVVAKVENELYSFIAFGRFVTGSGAGTGYVSKLYKVTKLTNTLTSITLPTAYTTNAAAFISDLGLHKEYLYISAQRSGAQINNHRMLISANTFQDVGGYGVLMRPLRGVLYHINIQSNIYAMTNETIAGSATYTLVDNAGQSDANTAAPTDALEFNGAMWIAKPEGIIRFDGVKAVKVLNLRTRKLCSFNGAIYFVSRQWLYKFDGTNVTKLQFFGLDEVFGDLSLSSNADYLFLETYTSSGTFQATTDKTAGSDGLRRIYTYDGQAFVLLYEFAMAGLYKAPTYGLVYTEDSLFDVYTIAQSASDTADEDVYYNRFDLVKHFINTNVTTSAKLEAVSSEFDAGYPNVYKSANLIEVQYKNMISGDSLSVKYQIFDGKNWGSWITLGTITSTTGNQLEITRDADMLFKRIKVSVTGTLAANSTFSMKGLTLRWTLQPRQRWRWQTLLTAYGTSIKDRFNTNITDTANTLNNVITKAIKRKTPIFLFTPDYAVVKTSANSAAVSVVLKGQLPIYTDPYSEYPMVAIKNASGVWEILRVSASVYNAGSDQTTLTILERGYLGIIAATFNVDAEVHLCYRVYVTRLVRDAPTLDQDTYDEQITKNSQLKREFSIEMIEV